MSQHNDEIGMLLLCLASDSPNLEEHVTVCRQLLADPQQRPWLLVAIAERLANPSVEMDSVGRNFLAEAACDALGQPHDLVDLIGDALPALLWMLSEESRRQPQRLWADLLDTIRSEVDLHGPTITPAALDADPEALQRADLIRRLLCMSDVQSVTHDVVSWLRDHPEDSWLRVMIDAKRAEKALVLLSRGGEPTIRLMSPQLLERLTAMTPFERRRVLTLRVIQQDERCFADPHANAGKDECWWRFDVNLESDEHVECYVQDELVGGMTLVRQPSGDVHVSDAHGLLSPLASDDARSITFRQAAADPTPTATELLPTLRCSIVPDRRVIRIQFTWHTP
jgi:hypothetical protein